jgi:hypothetical protein
MPSRDRRIEPRAAIQGNIWLHDIHSDSVVSAKLVNLSCTGLGVALERPIEPRSYVVFRATRTELANCACVRHCTWAKGAYRVGLELSGSLAA